MKNQRRTPTGSHNRPSMFPIDKVQASKRRKLGRLTRNSLLLLFTTLMLVFLALALIAWRPFLFSWQSRVIRAGLASNSQYTVHLQEEAFDGIDVAPPEAVYLAQLTEAIEPVVNLRFHADRPVTGSMTTRFTALLQAREPGDNQPVVLQTQEELMQPHQEELSGLADYVDSQTVLVPLAPYREQAQAIQSRLKQELVTELVLRYTASVQLALPAGNETLEESVSFVIPLDQPVFRISQPAPDQDLVLKPIFQTFHYQVALTALPYPIFLIAALLCLLCLILLITGTISEPKDRFWQTYRQMKKQLKGRLILLQDRAWDPAWCVAIEDFDSLAETARRLKYPVYGFLDTYSAWPVAYFYLLSGENNYVYIHTEHPELLDLEPAEEVEQARPIPVLPEADALPDTGQNPDLRPIHPYQGNQPD